MGTKESLIIELARFYGNMTIIEFNRRFGRYNARELSSHIRLAKVIYMQTGKKI